MAGMKRRGSRAVLSHPYLSGLSNYKASVMVSSIQRNQEKSWTVVEALRLSNSYLPSHLSRALCEKGARYIREGGNLTFSQEVTDRGQERGDGEGLGKNPVIGAPLVRKSSGENGGAPWKNLVICEPPLKIFNG